MESWLDSPEVDDDEDDDYDDAGGEDDYGDDDHDVSVEVFRWNAAGVWGGANRN